MNWQMIDSNMNKIPSINRASFDSLTNSESIHVWTTEIDLGIPEKINIIDFIIKLKYFIFIKCKVQETYFSSSGENYIDHLFLF